MEVPVKHMSKMGTLSPVPKRKIPTHEENNALVLRYQKHGDETALHTLLDRNSGLVYKEVHKYLHVGIPMEDLAQEGRIGFIQAIKKFDIARGYRLTTYAVPWIRKEILDHIILAADLVRVPHHRYWQILELRKKQSEFPHLTNDELREELGWSTQVFARVKEADAVSISLDEELEDGRSLLEQLPWASEASPLVRVLAQDELREESKKIQALLVRVREKVSPEAYRMLKLKLGIGNNGESQSFEAVAEKIGCTKQHVHQTLKRCEKRFGYKGLDVEKTMKHLSYIAETLGVPLDTYFP